MNNKIYAMELGFLGQLLDDRKELFSIARSFKSSAEMRAAREELMASLSAFNVTPKNEEEMKRSYRVDTEGVAHIPIIGELTPHAETDACGAYTANALTEYGFIIAATEAADRDEQVQKIQYEIDSPGGYADGIIGAVNALRSASKPTTAMVHGMAASAAYWLASQADEIIASSRASRVGSIGVAVEEYDDTKMLENAGITRRVYTSTEAPDKRPDTSTEDGQAKIIDRLDDMHRVFAEYVAEGRGVTVTDVNANYGRGGVLIAQSALRAGMVDRIENVPSRREETISDVVGETAATTAGNKTEEGAMDIKALQTEHPEVFAAVVEIGVKRERERVSELRSYIEADPENLKLAQVVNEAISGGSKISEINAKLQVAIRDGAKLAGENPPEVATTETADPLSEEDIQAAKLAGMTLDEYRKYRREV